MRRQLSVHFNSLIAVLFSEICAQSANQRVTKVRILGIFDKDIWGFVKIAVVSRMVSFIPSVLETQGLPSVRSVSIVSLKDQRTVHKEWLLPVTSEWQRRKGEKKEVVRGRGGRKRERVVSISFSVTYTDCSMFLSFVSERGNRCSWQPK